MKHFKPVEKSAILKDFKKTISDHRIDVTRQNEDIQKVLTKSYKLNTLFS